MDISSPNPAYPDILLNLAISRRHLNATSLAQTHSNVAVSKNSLFLRGVRLIRNLTSSESTSLNASRDFDDTRVPPS